MEELNQFSSYVKIDSPFLILGRNVTVVMLRVGLSVPAKAGHYQTRTGEGYGGPRLPFLSTDKLYAVFQL